MANGRETLNFVFSAGDKYDQGTGVWSRLLAPGFVDFMQIQDGESVLDVGCGTGNLALAIAEKTRAAKIVGIDLSQGFIDYARGKSKDPRLFFANRATRRISLMPTARLTDQWRCWSFSS